MGKLGKLGSVRVGDVVSEGVAVTFLPDDRLGGNKLLGMSFLGRFQVTIDDTNRQIILVTKP
jgi:aspartyl protease family protein